MTNHSLRPDQIRISSRVVSPSLRLIVIIGTVLMSAVLAVGQEKTCVEQLRELKLEILPGKVATHFSPGSRERAVELKALLERAANFYKSSLGLEPEVTLAAIGPKEWPLLLTKPYGLPTMRTGPCSRFGSNGPPQYLAIVPATVGGPIYKDWIAMKGSLSPKTIEKLRRAGMSYEQAGEFLLDFVALHELGHAYAQAMGIHTVSSFFAEFITDYMVYAFMRSTPERMDKKLMLVINANIEGITPIHANIDKFEKFQSREHPPTEAWYNSSFTVLAEKVYRSRDKTFLRNVQKAFANERYQSIDNDEILRRLDKIHPGFIKWSSGLASTAKPAVSSQR